MAIFFSALLITPPLGAQGNTPLPSACIASLQNPKLKNIDCILKFDLDKRTQKSMQANTAGLIRNAACATKISVARKMIVAALRDGKTMQVPRQQVQCNIFAFGKPVLTKFYMAPTIHFSKGKAIQTKPGMSDVVGIPEILAKLLADWVNSSEVIEAAMLNEVNRSLEYIRPLPLKK
ncbi:hypothetical protein MNBD_NITROSPINAE05-625 [hydrothermal vent metagenome]|uniref:Uncharacterized protein n=1 Tax=hydrothermal vent metagenome TaxID=652676 RepID=A0A3B1CX99_9ZZZZ